MCRINKKILWVNFCFFPQFFWGKRQKKRESTAGHHVKMSRWALQQVPLMSTCSPDTYLPRQSLSNFSLSCSHSLSVIHLSVIQLSCLFHLWMCLWASNMLRFPLSPPSSSLITSPLAGTGRVKGGRASVCQVGLVLQPQQQHTVIRVGRKQPLRLGSIKL